jgi:hypothetical protein
MTTPAASAPSTKDWVPFADRFRDVFADLFRRQERHAGVALDQLIDGLIELGRASKAVATLMTGPRVRIQTDTGAIIDLVVFHDVLVGANTRSPFAMPVHSGIGLDVEAGDLIQFHAAIPHGRSDLDIEHVRGLTGARYRLIHLADSFRHGLLSVPALSEALESILEAVATAEPHLGIPPAASDLRAKRLHEALRTLEIQRGTHPTTQRPTLSRWRARLAAKHESPHHTTAPDAGTERRDPLAR